MKRALALLVLLLVLVLCIALLRALLLGSTQTAEATQPDAFQVDGDAVAQRLAGALRIETISRPDAPVDAEAFARFHAYLAATWPRLHPRCSARRSRAAVCSTRGAVGILPRRACCSLRTRT